MHEYLRRILLAYGADQKIVAGLSLGEVAHDDWCRGYQGKGDCNCDPTIEVIEPGGRKFLILKDGSKQAIDH